MDDRSLAVVANIRRGMKNEPGVILEQICSDGTNLRVFCGGLRDDVGEIGDVVGCTRETVQFLRLWSAPRKSCKGILN